MITQYIKTSPYSIIALCGGLLIVFGALLPWVTFFGGLHTFAGISGSNGKILLGSGTFTTLLGIYMMIKRISYPQWIIGTAGFLQLAFSSYLLLTLSQTLQKLSHDAMNSMMVVGWGPGLFITTAGACILFSSFFWNQGKGITRSVSS